MESVISKSYTAFLFLFLFTIINNSVRSQNDIEQKVLSLEKQRFAAMINKDTMFLYKVLDDELVYSHTSGGTDTKQTFIRTIAEDGLVYKKMDLLETVTRSYKNTVIINGKMQVIVDSKKDNKHIEMTIKYLDVYRKHGKEWKLVAWQSARLP